MPKGSGPGDGPLEEYSALQEKADDSAYYRRILRVFDAFTSDADRRKHATALAACFDLNYDAPKDVFQIAKSSGISSRNVDKYELLLNKKQARKFLVDDCAVIGATHRQIRSVRIQDYRQKFSTDGKPREPFKRGRSSYWFTVAEWYVLLELDTPPVLPKRVIEFGRAQGMDL